MWKFLYRLGSPKWFYVNSGAWLPYILTASFLCLAVGLVWGLFLSPADYQQGDAFRIIYIHVPAAFLSLSLYSFMAFLSLLILVWRIKMAGVVLAVVPYIGAGMALIALVTGSLWGKPMWGTWWVWDARLTSELILLFLYVALIALRGQLGHNARGDRLVAILCLVGCIDIPIIHYSVEWWNSLHQGSTLSMFQKPKIATSMLYPLLLSILGLALYCAYMILQQTRAMTLVREKKQGWVKTIVQEAE